MARVTSVDLDARAVTTEDGIRLTYESLVLASGAVSTDFGVPGVAEHAFPAQAPRRRAGPAGAHPRPVRAGGGRPRPRRRGGGLDVVVCGGGPTGVEMAGGLLELYHKVLAKDFPQLPVADARIVLVEMADRLLTPFSEQSSRRARRTLERRGVEVRLGVGVERIEDTKVHLTDGSVIAAHTAVWATGVTAEALAATTGSPSGRGGRLVVEPDLSLPGHPEVFAVGDIAASPGRDGAPLPQVAQPAIQGGKHVARQILRRRPGPADRAVPLPRQGADGDDRPPRRGHRVPQRLAAERADRVAGVARPAPRLPDGVPQPPQRARQLGVELRHVRPRQPDPARVRARALTGRAGRRPAPCPRPRPSSAAR